MRSQWWINAFCLIAVLRLSASAETVAVLIGISDYGPGLNLRPTEVLRFPAIDAQGVYRVLLSPDAAKLDPARARILTNGQATLAAITEAIERWLPSAVKTDDSVIFYFAGHGHLEDGKGYLVPHDARRETLRATAYPMQRLVQSLVNLKAKSVLILTDACHAGVLNQDMAAFGKLRDAMLSGPESIISIAAAAPDQEAIEVHREGEQHTLFGQYLIQGLDGQADQDCNGAITAQELASYVQQLVARGSVGRQKPSVRIPKTMTGFVVARQTGQCVKTVGPLAHRDVLLSLEKFSCERGGHAVTLLDGRIAAVSCPGLVRLPGIQPGPHQVQVFQKDSAPVARQIKVDAAETPVPFELKAAEPLAPAAKALVEKARKLYGSGGKGNQTKALDLLNAARGGAPSSPAVAFELGRVLQAAGMLSGARAEYARAVSLNPAHLEARVLHADLTLRSGDSGEAIRQLLLVLPMLDNDYFPATLLSRAYQRTGLCEESKHWAVTAARFRNEDVPQPGPLIEYGNSLLQCAEKTPDREDRIRTYKLAAEQFRAAMERIRRQVGSNVTGDILRWTVGTAWLDERENKVQDRELRFNSNVGLCIAELQAGNICEALPACDRVVAMQPEEDARRLMVLVNVMGARAGATCGNRTFSWKKACDQLRPALKQTSEEGKVTVARLGSEIRSHAACP